MRKEFLLIKLNNKLKGQNNLPVTKFQINIQNLFKKQYSVILNNYQIINWFTNFVCFLLSAS